MRIERVREMHAGHRVIIMSDPHGTTTVYMLAEDITDVAAFCLADVLTLVEQRVCHPARTAGAAVHVGGSEFPSSAVASS